MRDAALATADALVVRSATKVTSALIAKAPKLRVVARAGTGVDTIDVDAATARGILVINAPGANSVSVAELAMGLALALVRHLAAADASMKVGQWEKSKFTGDELSGRTLGLVGFGRIGREVAQRARAFDMTVLTADPFLSAGGGSRRRRRTGQPGRSSRARRRDLAARAVDGRDPPHHQSRDAGRRSRRARA